MDNPISTATLLQWLESQLTPDLFVQTGLALIALPISWLLVLIIRRILRQARQRLAGWGNLDSHPHINSELLRRAPRAYFAHLLDQAVQIVNASLRPLLIWGLIAASARVLLNLGRPSAVLVWLGDLVALFVVYSALLALVSLRFPDRMESIQRQVLRPGLIILVLLQGLGLLDSLLSLGFAPSAEMVISVRSILLALLVWYIFNVTAHTTRTLLRESLLPRLKVETSISQILHTVTFYALLTGGALSALRVLGVDLSNLFILAGGLSVGIGFGLQQIVNNFISGFILLFERSILPNDIIEVEGKLGMVKDVGLRSVRLRTPDGVELTIPSSMLLNDVVTNYARTDNRTRLHIPIGVTYNADPRQVTSVLLQAASCCGALQEPPPRVRFTNFGDSALEFELLIWVSLTSDVFQIMSDVRYLIWDHLKEAGIEIPYPQQDLHVQTLPAGLENALQAWLEQKRG